MSIINTTTNTTNISTINNIITINTNCGPRAKT